MALAQERRSDHGAALVAFARTMSPTYRLDAGLTALWGSPLEIWVIMIGETLLLLLVLVAVESAAKALGERQRQQVSANVDRRRAT